MGIRTLDGRMIGPSIELHFQAVERVAEKLKRSTDALNNAGIAYAVIGGNAVAAWVAQWDPGAVRSTQDVDILVDGADIDSVVTAMESAGFVTHRLRGFLAFTTPDDPNRRSGVHVISASVRLRPSYLHPTPSPSSSVRCADGFFVLDLESLLKMKLTSFRDRDKTHIRDLLSVGAIAPEWAGRLPPDLRARFEQILSSPEEPDFDDEAL